MKFVTAAGELASARQVLTEALSSGWSGTDPFEPRVQHSVINRSLGQIAHGLECGKVLSALDKAPKAAVDWALYTYGIGERERGPELTPVTRYVIHRYRAILARENKLPLRAIKVSLLIPSIIIDYSTQLTGGKRRYTACFMQDKLGLKPTQRGNWARDYQPYIDIIEKEIIDKLDREALAPVAALIAEVAEQEVA